MKKILIKNSLSVVGQTISLGIVWLILYRLIVETIGIESLGVWSLVLATISASRFSEMGFSACITKFVASYNLENNEKAASDAVQTAAISLGVIIFFVGLLMYPALKIIMPYFFPKNNLGDALQILPYAIISMWLSVISGIWMAGLDGCLRSDIRSGLMIFSNFVLIVLAIILLKDHGLVGLALAQIAQGIFLFISGWLALKKIMPVLPNFPKKWKGAEFKAMLSYGSKFQVNSVVMILFDPITKLLLGHFDGLSSVGFFEIANRIILTVRSLIISSNQVIVPLYASIREGELEQINRLYIQNMKFMFFLMTPIFAGLIAVLPVVSEIWFGRRVEQFNLIGLFVAIGWYFNSINAPAYFVYLGRGRLNWIMGGFAIMGVLNIFLGVGLGYFYQLTGIMVAYVISLSAGSAFITYAYHKENKFKKSIIFSINDLSMILRCTGLVAIELTVYFIADLITSFNRSTIYITIIISSGAILMYIIHLHPLSRQLYLMVTGKK